ncbi:MAG: iron ABC transporter substrate-binding protein [Bacteroidales bacterium]|nr:iron ABC transporter substrate-binding protein [Bacteroidales bacterium]
MVSFNRIINTLLLSILILLLLGCGTKFKNDIKSDYRSIKDMSGRTVQIPSEIKSIIALKPGALRFVTYLDAADKVIGIEGHEKRRKVPYLMAHPELRDLPLIGTGNIAEPELITALNPDLIICTYTTAGKADDLQNKTGIPVFIINYGDFNENIDTVFSALSLMGKVLKKEERADSLITYIKFLISDLNERTNKITVNNDISVYIGGIAYKGSHGLNSTEPHYAPFTFVNAGNIASYLGEVTSSPRAWLENAFIDKEQIIKWNPDKIFLDASGKTLLNKDLSNESPFYHTLDAIKNCELYVVMPHNWYTINYATVLCNAYFVGKVLNEENFNDIEIKNKADEIYTYFLGKPVYEQMKEKYGAYRKLDTNSL